MSGSWAGALVGALGGLGLWLVVAHVQARRPRLDDRLAPYLRPPAGSSSLLRAAPTTTPFASLERVLAPVMHDAVRLVERLGSPRAELERRLVRAGSETTVEQFRAEQVVAGVLGTAVGLALAGALVAGRGLPPVAGLVVVALGGIAGVLARDQALSRQVARREATMLAELPTVAELLALAVGAGEGALAALERVARTTHGELSREIGRAVADTRSGTPVTVALQRMADRTGLAGLARFADAIAVAVDRGTPLADVLRAQAEDVRDAGKRSLMETGGRKEVLMMVPVVFLILPVTVVFALFPGLAALRIGL